VLLADMVTRTNNYKNKFCNQQKYFTTVYCDLATPLVCNTIDTRIHNGLETQYILRLLAQYGHAITFTGYRCISNGHNILFACSFLEDRYLVRLTDITFALLKV